MNLRTCLWPVLVLVALAGCRALPPAPPPTLAVSQEEVLARLAARSHPVQAFQAKGRITYLSPKENYSGAAQLTGRLPATLKVAVLDFLGRTVLSFACNGTEIQMLSPREGKMFTGPATPQSLAAFIPPAVALPQALRLLVGALPLSPGPPQSFSFDAAQGLYRLAWGPAEAPQERLWVSAQGLYPVKEEWYGGSPEPRFTAELSGFGAVAPELPAKITLKTSRPQVELRLAFSELRPNPPLTAADFQLQPPPGVAVVPLGP